MMRGKAGECCCGKPRSKRRTGLNAGITAAGFVGWLLIPKCPMCLAAYAFAFSGMTLTYQYSMVTHRALLAVMVGMMIYGVVQLGRRRVQS